jgi:TATA-box binding
MLRKKGIAILVFTLFIGFTLVANHIGAEGNDSKISRIAEGMEKNGVHIDKWSLYAKKNVDKKTINDVKQMAAQYRQYNWSYEQDNEVFKAIGEFENKEKNITEKLQILTTLTNDLTESYILYEVQGEGTQSDWDKLNEYVSNQSFDIFHENVTIFACINGTTDDNINVSLIQKSKKFLNEFEASSVEQLVEKDFTSLSAKTPLWEDFIPTNNDEMNIQIAMRTDGMGDKTTVVIGTPIITSEY